MVMSDLQPPPSPRAQAPTTSVFENSDVGLRERATSLDVLPAGRLVRAIQDLSLCRDVDGIMAVVRSAARQITSADGATFVLRDGGRCFYADEEAISPLWKGRRFPIDACISGWVMQNHQPVVLDDVFADPRIPTEVYKATFVKSLAMVPIRTERPIGAIGCYWATHHRASAEQVQTIQALADSTSTAIENVQLYAELGRRAHQAEEAVQLRDEFLSAAAHELRTPLTTLQLQLDLLARGGKAGGVTASDRIGRARASSLKLADLIALMLDASQLTESKLALSPCPCDLAAILCGVVERFKLDAQRAGCELLIDMPTSVCGQWDRGRLIQVASALFASAVRRGSGRPVAIRLRVESGQGVVLSVRDGGPAMSRAELDKVFERFARVGPDPKTGGLGLGLYLVRLVTEAHGGIVSAQSEVGEGLTVNVSLPWSCTG